MLHTLISLARIFFAAIVTFTWQKPRFKIVAVNAAIAMGLVSGIMPLQASAMGVISESGPLFQPIRRASLDNFATALELDHEQKATMLELFKGYRESIRRAAADADTKIEAAEKAEDRNHKTTRMNEFDQTKAFLAAADKLEMGFFTDLRAILAPEQVSKMDTVERAHRRAAGIRFCFAAGENVDIVDATAAVGIANSPAVAEIVSEYERTLDEQLKTKRLLLSSVFERVAKMEIESEGFPNPAAIFDDLRKLVDHSIKVRDSNRSLSKRISGAVDDEKREKWENYFRDKSYPRVYSTSTINDNLAAALKLSDLNDDQRNRLTTLQETYSREVLPLNNAWASAIDEKVIEFREKGFEMIMSMAMADEESQVTDPLAKARKARFELDEENYKKIASILNEEQAKGLPHKTSKHPEISDMMRDVIALDESAFEGSEKEFIGDEAEPDEQTPQTAK